MLNKKIVPVALLILLIVSVITTASEKPAENKAVNMPENVKAIIDKSCFGCHNSDSKNDKAKEKLDLKTLDQLSLPKMIGALNEIGETIKGDEMPPEKFLERFPDKKLSAEEKKILMDWAKKEAKTLVN